MSELPDWIQDWGKDPKKEPRPHWDARKRPISAAEYWAEAFAILQRTADDLPAIIEAARPVPKPAICETCRRSLEAQTTREADSTEEVV